MRLVAGASLIAHGLARLQTGPPIQLIVSSTLAMAVGILLLAGLWTPISGSLVAAMGIWNTISRPGDPWACIFFATMPASLDGSASMFEMAGASSHTLLKRVFFWLKRVPGTHELVHT